ncbi:uncharacterized protein AB675_9431 [Cyphellophora attinorum]|uniref:Uncharacterized protein n=1 Tax=Cyphellophora attinorum TaxID=1664694 RepID=A0A0N1H1J7_9EURO|nr:uncharacterized protein AB675_9431 [Phialophora attinorum]KPI34695.1 hypothetical protein AB675_9431 [Phialophora attinorum]
MLTSTLIFSLLGLTLATPTLHPLPLHRRQDANLQPFTGAIGGEAATPVVNSGNADRPFQVGQDTFVNIAAALQRSCDQQFNRCANAANGGGGGSVAACQTQKGMSFVGKSL